MFSSWDERRFMGAVLCVITKSVSYWPHRLFVLRTLCQRPVAAVILPWINQDCHFHRSTLLLNLNSADNVPNIKFNAILKIQTILKSTKPLPIIFKRHASARLDTASVIVHHIWILLTMTPCGVILKKISKLKWATVTVEAFQHIFLTLLIPFHFLSISSLLPQKYLVLASASR